MLFFRLLHDTFFAVFTTSSQQKNIVQPARGSKNMAPLCMDSEAIFSLPTAARRVTAGVPDC